MEVEQKNEIRAFWNFICQDRKDFLISCNYKFKINDSILFSKNHFVTSAEQLVAFAEEFGSKDCYCTCNSLKEKTTRKFDNLKELSMLGLDIEFKDKQKIETPERIITLQKLVKKRLVENYGIKKYFMTASGNGIHLFIDLGKSLPITVEMKTGYREMIKVLECDVNFKITKTEKRVMSMTDRKEINFVLRIPETMNTKCMRTVKVLEYSDVGCNTAIRQKLFRQKNFEIKFAKNHIKQVVNTHDLNAKLIPINDEELFNHPISRAMLDTTLPEVTGWYYTCVFGLQAIIKAGGMQNTPAAFQLQSDINSLWSTDVNLSDCSTDDYMGPVLGAYKFFNQNGFDIYTDELHKLLNSKEEENR